MESVNMKIVEMGGDGNCLFRAISYQAYGTEDCHQIIRQYCMDYILSEKQYFQSYIEGGKGQIENYCTHKRNDGVWGDDLEL